MHPHLNNRPISGLTFASVSTTKHSNWCKNNWETKRKLPLFAELFFSSGQLISESKKYDPWLPFSRWDISLFGGPIASRCVFRREWLKGLRPKYMCGFPPVVSRYWTRRRRVFVYLTCFVYTYPCGQHKREGNDHTRRSLFCISCGQLSTDAVIIV